MAVGFPTIRDYADAREEGRSSFCAFRKVPSQATTARWWVDLSMAAGNPQPNYYVGGIGEATALTGSRGLFHGFDKSPSQMHLARFGLASSSANGVGAYYLLDYLMFYPYLDLDATEKQVMDNPITLPRYTDGVGVLPMMVCLAPTIGGGTFKFDYYNQAGVLKTAPTQSFPTTASTMTQLLSQPATTSGGYPFLLLASGDTGVRSIASFTVVTPGSGGLGCIVLAKTITESMVYELSVPREIEFVVTKPGAPRIYDGAYLHLILNCGGTVASVVFTGYCEFIWTR